MKNDARVLVPGPGAPRISAGLDSASREALLVRLGELAEHTTALPDAWLIVASAPIAPPSAPAKLAVSPPR